MKMNPKKFRNELELRSFFIVRFLYNIILIPFLVANIVNLVNIVSFSYDKKDIPAERIMLVVTTFVLTVILLYVRFRVLKKHYRIAFGILAVITGLLGILGLLTTGTAIAIPYILFLIIILSSSIVYGVKVTLNVSVILSLIIPTIYVLHLQKVIAYEPELSTSKPASSIMYACLIVVFAYIAKVAYSQIEHSYSKAYQYLKELEKLNRELESTVNLRTKQLRENFERQADSVYSAAVIGSITQPMMHDLLTPLSALKGAMFLLEENEDNKKILENSKASVSQLERIIGNARELMTGKKIESEFEPKKEIENILFVVKDKLYKGNIKVKFDVVEEDIKLIGVSAIFSRILTNVIQNAIEELLDSGKDKKSIKISLKKSDEFAVVEIEDTGRGIKQEYLSQIFSPEFSTKGDTNLGFGLGFVKSNTEKYFNGSVAIESQEGKYTRFILKFKSNNETESKK